METNNIMSYAVGAMLVRNKIQGESKKLLAESIMGAIREAFKTNLDNLDWMDDGMRGAVKDKADAIAILIGISFHTLWPH